MAELNNPPNHRHSRYSNIDPILYDQLEGLGVLSMKEAFGKSPYDFQKELITHLLLMACPRSSWPCAPVFFFAPTFICGHSWVDCATTVLEEPSLSLSLDDVNQSMFMQCSL